MEIIKADFIVQATISAENLHRERNRLAAMKVLEEQNFNERVQTAAAAESWRLGNPIDAPSIEIAVSIKEILEDAGYEVEIERNSWNSDSTAKVRVSWRPKQTRTPTIQEKYENFHNAAEHAVQMIRDGKPYYDHLIKEDH